MSDTQTLKRKTVSGVVNYTFRTVILYGISILATGLLSAFLTPAEFGTYFVVTALISLFTFMSDVGLAATLIQKKTEPSLEELRTTFTVQQLLAIGIVAIAVSLNSVWQSQFNLNEDGLILLYALSFSFILASFKTIPSILLERKLEFGKLVIPQIVESVLFYGLAVWFASKGFGVTSYTYAVIARSLGGIIAIYAIQRWPIGLSLNSKALPSLVNFGAKFQLNDLLARIKDDLFIVVLKKFISDDTLGFIGWAKRWSMFPYQFSVNSVVSITFPTFSRIQDDRQLLSKAIEKTIFFISLVIFPILAGMVILAYPLTQLIPAYHKWQPAIPYLLYFCINIACAAIANPFINALNAIGKIHQTLKLMLTMTVATWVITPLIMTQLGSLGVAITAAIVAAMSLYSYRWINQYAPVNVLSQIWLSILATGGMSLVMVGLSHWTSQSWINFLVSAAFGATIYLGIVLGIGYQKIITEIRSLK